MRSESGRFSQGVAYQRNFVPVHPSQRMPLCGPVRLARPATVPLSVRLRLMVCLALAIGLPCAGIWVAFSGDAPVSAHPGHIVLGAALGLYAVVWARRASAAFRGWRGIAAGMRPGGRAEGGERADRPRY
ncbi:hypothetical protein DL237_06435 [Pseudooceanicola sediminis]|uniref:Uncharacterized protein n=1 Tax=Pseudooceanicola sediminis TaxID=2211117 RepID=A0A399J386_9RHOB|nr:hypothetical protein [Pseudooceanicola sediminis]KAA2317423.1 hypothetical protein E0K93_03810 [Puniceibacterium sp. HSS470]RII39775.1 hypothetical protein DL237_06435 [Pseudooceanicola sediminis]|tara:strand:- start:1676 stop:2065 length:390 start_codon:yes stop_codon:yes gene_type:complete